MQPSLMHFRSHLLSNALLLLALCPLACKPGAQPKFRGPEKAVGSVDARRKAWAPRIPSSKRSEWKEIAKDVTMEIVSNYLEEKLRQTNAGTQLPPVVNDQMERQRQQLHRLISAEIQAALREGRAYAGTNRLVRILGGTMINKIYVDLDGLSYLVAHVQSSTNPAIAAGDIIFAANGTLFAPGRDLTVILNLPGAPSTASLAVIRGDWIGEVNAQTSLIVPTDEEVANRRVVDAVEKVLIDLAVKAGHIKNPAWR